MRRVLCLVMGGMMFACLLLGGCKKAGEKAAEKAIEAGMAKEGVKADVDVSGDKITIKSEDGKTEFSGGKSAKVPEDFPKDVYIYEGAAVKAALTVPGGCNLVMETGDGAEKVLAAIKGKMAANGWKEAMNMSQGDHVMLQYRKGQRSTMVNVDSSGKMTTITLTTAEDKG